MVLHHIGRLISASVGSRAANHKDDVKIIQYLFNLIDRASVFEVNGVCTQALLNRIHKFQVFVLRYQHPDCLIDPSGATLRAMVKYPTLSLGSLIPPQGGVRSTDQIQQRVDKYLQRSLGWVAQERNLARQATAPAGSTSRLSDADFAAAAEALKPNVQIAMIRAFAEVEFGGKSGFGSSGLPIIAFEGHIFRKYTDHAYDKTNPLLSYPYKQKAGPEWRKNSADQQTAWNTLNQALILDHSAALMSCSWGMFQVMGFNYKDCGYNNVDDFVSKMKAGERGQLDAFVGFCKANPKLRQALADRNFVICATLYNGKDYGNYDKLIEIHFKKLGGK